MVGLSLVGAAPRANIVDRDWLAAGWDDEPAATLLDIDLGECLDTQRRTVRRDLDLAGA